MLRVGFLSKLIYKFYQTKHKRNKKYYLLKNHKTLIVNSIPQGINIHVIKTFSEKNHYFNSNEWYFDWQPFLGHFLYGLLFFINSTGY